jgi:DnaJ-class molecular chaperone
MKQSHNPWTLLGVSENSNLEDIKLAYKKLAARWHPDRIDGDAEKFKIIQVAYTQLKNKSHVPVVVLPETKLVNVKLSICQQIRGVDDLLQLDDQTFIKVKIPAGAKKDEKFKVKSQGTQYIINIQELAHSDFTRSGNNIIMTLYLDIIDAMLGRTVVITGPQDQPLDIAIPAGVKPGTLIVLERQGMYDRKKRVYGNLHCTIAINIPVLTTAESIQTFITRLTNDRN